ncbi:MAG: beta strand repeat-containing protein [Prosthecobacter sp.]
MNNVLTGANLGGTGTWDTLTTSNWWDGLSASDVPWNNANLDTAVFWGSAGTVTLGAAITAGALQFETSGYTLAGGTLAIAGTGAITADLGTYTTLASQLNGTNGLTLAGTGSSGRGTVRLTNDSNNYTGTTTINSGTLVITNDGQLGDATNAVAINGVQTAGLAGGSLLLAGSTTASGYATGITVGAARSVTMIGGGVGYANSTPPGSGSALVSVGNNTIAGQFTATPTTLGPATGAVSGFGVLTLPNVSVSGTAVTNFVNFGSNGSIGGYNINGTLSGTGSIHKTGLGTLILEPMAATGFSGTVRVTTGSVRVSDPLAMGTNVNTGLNSVFDLNGGVFEVRADTFDASTKGLAFRAAATLHVDHAIGSSEINGTATFGNFLGNVNIVTSFNSRNGFNTTFNASTVTPTSSATSFGITNSGNGLVTITGNVWGQTTAANTFTVTATGNILFTTGVTATAANTTNQFTKAGAGTLTISGVASTIVSPTSVNAGTLAITDFRSLTLASTQNINLGATTTAATLTIGTTTAATAAGLTAAATRVINMAGTTGGATINANQTVAFPVILTAPFAATGVGAKTLTLGGTSTGGSDATPNTINGAIGNAATGFAQTANSASGATTLTFANTSGILVGQHVAGTGIAAGTTVTAVTATTVTLSRGTIAARTTESLDVSNGAGAAVSLTKADGGTWQLAGVNTYTGTTTITNGVLKLKANAAASTIIADASAITFNSNAATLTAGGALEFIGVSGSATTETLGALTSTAGAGKVTLTSGGAGAAANLTFASLGATTAASSVNFSTTGGGGGVITLTGQAATTATTLPGTANFLGHLYINGADFAAINGSAQVITPAYGSTAGFVLGGAVLTAANHNWVDAAITSQPAVSVTSLKMTTADLTLDGNLTLNTGALLQTGGSAKIDGTAAGRTILGAAAATNIVIRVNNLSDTLTLTSNVSIGSTQTGGFTKNGAGTLVIAGTNAQTGATTINEGTVRLSGTAARLSATSVATVLRQGATLDLNGQSTGVAIGSFDGAGTVTNSGNGTGAAGTLVLGNISTGAGIFSGVIQDGTGPGAGVTNVSVTGTTGSPTWSGLNTYSGVTTIGTGLTTTAKLVNVTTLADYGSASSIGKGNLTLSDANNAGSLVLGGLATAGIAYTGTTSVSIDRLFTLNGGFAGAGGQIANNSANNSTLIMNGVASGINNRLFFGAGATVAQTLTLGGSSTGDNLFNIRILDNGLLATSLNKVGAGLWILGNAGNDYTGTTTIGHTTVAGGVLQAQDGSTLPNASYLILGSGTTGGGVFQSTGLFTRNIGTSAAANTITLGAATATTAAVGFSAADSKLIIALGGTASPTALTWGSGGFMGTTGVSTGAFVLNSVYSLDEIEVRNAINLNGATRTIQVDDNTSTFTDLATITGVISNGTGTAGLTKTGTGILQLLAANTYNGPTSVSAGTLVVTSLGSSTGSGGTSVGIAGPGADTLAQALILGNGSTTAGLLNYVGPGEISDRYIQINTTTGNTQIIADGSGPLVLSNLLNSGAGGIKILYLRGANTFANEISSNLADNGGTLSITHDSAGTWILSGNNSYTGATSISLGTFGVGSDSAFGGFGGTPGSLSITNGTFFATGGDRTIRNAVIFSGTNSTIAAFVGENSLTFTGNWADGTTTSSGRFLRNNIVSGKTLTLNGNYVYTAVTSSVSNGVFIDGSGDTIINGNISQNPGMTGNTAAGLMGVVYGGTGSLTLGGTGNNYLGETRISNGTLKLGASEVIPESVVTAAATTTAASSASTTVTAPTASLYPGMTILGGSAPAIISSITNATSFVASVAQTIGSGTSLTFSINRGNVVLNPAAGVTATFDLNGFNETISGLTATSAGNAVITNTAAGPASLILGASNAAVNINSAGGGVTTITNTGGALSLTKIGTGIATIGSGQTLTYTGSTTVTGGTLTIASALNGTSALSATGAGSILNLNGLISAPASINSVTVGAGAFLSFLDGVGTPLSSLSTLNLGAGSGTATLSLELGATSDTLTSSAAATVANTIRINIGAAAGLLDNTAYDLLVAPGGLGALSNYILGIQPPGYSTGSLSMVGDTRLVYTSGAPVVGSLYWNNTLATGSWATSIGGQTNFTTNLAGTTDGTYVPGPATSVIFGTTNTTTLSGSSFTTTLDASFSVASLQFTANPAGVTAWTINTGTPATSSLTINAGGIAVDSNAGVVTINAPVVLGAAQSWSVHGGGANSSLIVGGAITGGAAATLAISSSGTTGLVSMNAVAGMNTYSGTTTVSNGGILQGGAVNSFSANSDFIVNGTGILRLNGFSNTVRSLAGSGTVQNNHASSAVVLTVGGSNASTTFSGSMVNGGVGTLGLTKVGTGTLTLGGTSTYTGITTVQNGGLRITGSVNNSPAGAGGTTAIGNTASTFGLVDLPSGGSLTTTSMSVGGAVGGVGSLVIRGGSATTTTTATNTGISVGTGGYGALLISAGSLTVNRVSLYNSATGTGVLQISGGTLTSTEHIILSNLRTEFTVRGGSVIHNAASQGLNIGYNLSGTTVMNMAGGTVDNTGRSVSFGLLSTESPTGILNLGGGTLTTNSFTVGTTVTATMNFNGGTLRAAIDSTAFIPSSSRLSAYVNGAFGTFAGGAVIDTNGKAITIASSLLSPVGSSGVSGLSLGGVGSGYIGAPYVEIVRGAGDTTGTGATGYAIIDTDPASPTYGQVTGVVLTNPGMNYTATPTVNLVGGLGAGGTAAVITASGISANTSGGLTKNGAGTLTLTGANTYSGGTVVNTGTLTVGTGGTLGATTGALTVNNTNTGAGNAVVVNLATATDTTVGSLSGTLATPSSGSNTATINTQTGRTFTVNQTTAGTYAGVIAGPGSVALGSLSTNTLTLIGANTYTGGTYINGGTLTVGTGGTLGATTGSLAVNNSNTGAGTAVVLNLATAADTTVGSLSGTLATPSSGSNTATINTQTGRTFTINQTAAGTYAGTIAGSGSVTLGSLSTNTLTLTGANSYTGTTTVNGGTLEVNNTTGSGTGTGDVTLNNPGSKLSGSGSIAGHVVLNTGTVLAPGEGSTNSSNKQLTFTAAGTAVEVKDGGQIQLGLTSSSKIDTAFNWDTQNALAYLNSITAGGTNLVASSAYVDYWKTSESTYDSIVLPNGTFRLGATAGGTVDLVNNGGTYALGNIFKLLDWSTLGTNDSLAGDGSFTTASNLDLSGITLGSGLGWDTSAFSTFGVIVIVPEPSRLLFLLPGFAGLLMRRRRNHKPLSAQ